MSRSIGSRAKLNGRDVVWSGDNYGWQSPATYSQLKSQGKFKAGAQQLDRIAQSLSRYIPQPVKDYANAVQTTAARNAEIDRKNRERNPAGRLQNRIESKPSATERVLQATSDKLNVDRRIVDTTAAAVQAGIEGKVGIDALRVLPKAQGSRIANRLANRVDDVTLTRQSSGAGIPNRIQRRVDANDALRRLENSGSVNPNGKVNKPSSKAKPKAVAETVVPTTSKPDRIQKALAIRASQESRRFDLGQNIRSIDKSIGDKATHTGHFPETFYLNEEGFPTGTPDLSRRKAPQTGKVNFNRDKVNPSLPKVSIDKPSAKSTLQQNKPSRSVNTERVGHTGVKGAAKASRKEVVVDEEGIGRRASLFEDARIQGPLTKAVAEGKRNNRIRDLLDQRKINQRNAVRVKQVKEDIANRRRARSEFQGPLTEKSQQMEEKLYRQEESRIRLAKNNYAFMGDTSQKSDRFELSMDQMQDQLKAARGAELAGEEAKKMERAFRKQLKTMEFDKLKAEANFSGEAKQKVNKMRRPSGKNRFRYKKQLPGQNPANMTEVRDRGFMDFDDVYEDNAERTVNNWADRVFRTNEDGEFIPEAQERIARRIEQLKSRPTSPVKWVPPKQRQTGRTEIPTYPVPDKPIKGAPPTRGERRHFDQLLQDIEQNNRKPTPKGRHAKVKDDDLFIRPVYDRWNPKKVGKEQALRNFIEDTRDAEVARQGNRRRPTRWDRGRGSKGSQMFNEPKKEMGELYRPKEEIKELLDQYNITQEMIDNVDEATRRTAYRLDVDVEDLLVYRAEQARLDSISRYTYPEAVSFRKKVDDAAMADYTRAKERAIVEAYEDELGGLSLKEYEDIYGKLDSQQRITGGKLKTENGGGRLSHRLQFREARARRGHGDTRHRPRKDDRIRKALAGRSHSPAEAITTGKPTQRRVHPRKFKASNFYDAKNEGRTVPIGKTVLDKPDYNLNQPKPARGGRIRSRVLRRRNSSK
jgi:hypothetical protein